MNTKAAPAIFASAPKSPASEQRLPIFNPKYLVPFVLVTALFFLWAIPNNLNDVLIQQFMKSFQISRFQAGLVQSAFYLGYFFVSMPAAMVMRRFGYKKGLVIGLLLYGAGCLLFWPAAEVQQFSFFLLALFVIATGLAFLETGGSSFITQLGEPETSERRLNLSQSFNPPGTIAGALIGTVFILSGITPTPPQVSAMKAAGTYAAYLHHETLRVVIPYVILSCVVFIFAFVLARTEFPPSSLLHPLNTNERHGSLRNLLRFRHFKLGVVSQFFYIGAQVGTWSYLIQYVIAYVHKSEKAGGYFLILTLIIFALGRATATYLMKFIQPRKLMGFYAVINILLVLLAILFPGWIGLVALLCSSFFMSLMYPTNFALGVKELV
jgi:FHS family L-fucose permease-like MFS transporter